MCGWQPNIFPLVAEIRAHKILDAFVGRAKAMLA